MDHCSYCGKPMPLGCCSPWEDIVVTHEPPKATTWAGIRLMILFMWDAVFHRKPDPHMHRAMELDQDNAPSYPHKREDAMHNGRTYSDE